MSCEDCDITLNDTEANNARLAGTVTSGIGLLLESFILVTIICTKAFKTFLQRLFIWILLSILVMDSTQVASIGYNTANSQGDYSCEVLGFVNIWSYWCFYLLLKVLIVSTTISLYIQTRAAVTKPKHLRVMLEIGAVLGSVIFPIIVLWMPFKENIYGYNGVLCTLTLSKVRNNSDIYRKEVMAAFCVYTPPELAGVVSILAAMGVIVFYCTLSTRLKGLKHVRRLIKNLVASLIVVFTLFMTFNAVSITRVALSEYYFALVYLSMLVLTLEKIIVLTGYLLVFHYSKVCGSVRKLCSCRRQSKHKPQENCNEYGTFRESNRDTAPSTTYFNVPYTGEFTTV